MDAPHSECNDTECGMPERLNLRELIELLDDGRRFYETAAENAEGTAFKDLFRRMAQTKAAIAGALNARLRARGEPAEGDGTLLGHLRQGFAEICAHFSTAPDATYVEQLERFEDRMRDAFREAAGESADAETRTLAAKYLPDVLRDHSEMSALKRELRSAH